MEFYVCIVYLYYSIIRNYFHLFEYKMNCQDKCATELQTQKKNIIEAIVKTGYGDLFTEKLEHIESEMLTVTEMLQRQEKSNKRVIVTEEMIREYLGSFKQFILKRDKPQIKKFVNAYVERVDIYHDKVKVTLKVSLSSDQQKNIEYSFEKDASREEIRTA